MKVSRPSSVESNRALVKSKAEGFPGKNRNSAVKATKEEGANSINVTTACGSVLTSGGVG